MTYCCLNGSSDDSIFYVTTTHVFDCLGQVSTRKFWSQRQLGKQMRLPDLFATEYIRHFESDMLDTSFKCLIVVFN